MKRVVFSLLVALVASLTYQQSQGSTSAVITVNTNRDGGADGACSLREAITAANLNLPIDGCAAGTPGDIPGDVIQFATAEMEIALTLAGANEDYNQTGDLDILESVVIEGNLTSVNALQLDRVFHIHAGSVTFQDISILGGDSGKAEGGGIYVASINVPPTILDSVNLQGNRGESGGGIYSAAPLVIRQSAIVDNAARGGGYVYGGGIVVIDELVLENSTVSRNHSSIGQHGGGGILVGDYGLAVIRNSTVVENYPENITVFDGAFAHYQDSILQTFDNACNHLGTGISISGGHNILPENGACGAPTETDVVAHGLLLGPLDYWGGPTLNYLLLPRTAGVDNGSCTDGVVTVDQRGVSRPQGERCDIGAHERDESTSIYFVYLPTVLK